MRHLAHAGATDFLLWRIALSKHLPDSYADASRMDSLRLVQAEVLLDEVEDMERQAREEAELNRRALANARKYGRH